MLQVGTESHPLRVAIIGAGPAGFYAADHLLRRSDLVAEVDLFDRLPTPFGLVRAGVAPDHQKIKNVTRIFEKTAAHARFRFFGNVEFGRHLTRADLQAHYHQILYATGAQTDRDLGLPGEEMPGSHSATEFVAWYNCHPDYRHLRFDLSQERVAIIGVGNVALDVARILCRTPEELAQTDIADHALEALRHSQVREVYVLGRRGPAQAAFTNPEVRELGELEAVDVFVPPEEAELDALSQAALERDGDRTARKNVEIVQEYAHRHPKGHHKRLTLRFLVSPVAFLPDAVGRLRGLRLVRNELYLTDDGRLRPRATEAFEELEAGLVFRSVGYHGVPLPDVPFHERDGIIPNACGRILDEQDHPLPGEYVGGWIKRGPTGVIGTNKADAAETVSCMVEDASTGDFLDPAHPAPEAIEALLCKRQPHIFTYADWQRLDEIETAAGEAAGRPRVKLSCVDDMLAALNREARRAASA